MEQRPISPSEICERIGKNKSKQMGGFWIWQLDLGFFILEFGFRVYGLWSFHGSTRALDLCSLHSLDFAEYVQSTAKKM